MNAISPTLEELRHTADLVRAAQSGDRGAFGHLFDKYHRGVHAIAYRRLRNVDAAQELCQDVFVQALEKIDQLRAPECFGAWIRSITVRMAINRQVRRRAMVSMEPTELCQSVEDRHDPFEMSSRAEQAAHVRSGLRRLRRMDRETLTAFYIKGQTLNEMAREFGAPLGTIKRRLHVARKRLAQEFDGSAAG